MENKSLKWNFERIKPYFLSLKNNNTNLINKNNRLNKQIQHFKLENHKFNKEINTLKEINQNDINEISSLKQTIQNNKLNNPREFINFQEFLAKSYISPVIKTPFHMKINEFSLLWTI